MKLIQWLSQWRLFLSFFYKFALLLWLNLYIKKPNICFWCLMQHEEYLFIFEEKSFSSKFTKQETRVPKETRKKNEFGTMDGFTTFPSMALFHHSGRHRFDLALAAIDVDQVRSSHANKDFYPVFIPVVFFSTHVFETSQLASRLV